jgi:hypothetical protein
MKLTMSINISSSHVRAAPCSCWVLRACTHLLLWFVLVVHLTKQQTMRSGHTKPFSVESPHPNNRCMLPASVLHVEEEIVMEKVKSKLTDLAERSNTLFRDWHEVKASMCPVWVKLNIGIDQDYGLVDRELILYSSLRVEDVGTTKGVKCGTFNPDFNEEFSLHDGCIPTELGFLTSESMHVCMGDLSINHDVILPTELSNLQALALVEFRTYSTTLGNSNRSWFDDFLDRSWLYGRDCYFRARVIVQS